MSRFKHRLKEPFGKAGLTVAILALVMALVGGAYAAGGLTKSQEKQVTKIAKKYAGKPGATGPAGANGTNGTNGKDGANGTNGKDGAPGIQGPPGTTGFTKTLPKGETLEGDWAITAVLPGTGLNEGSAGTTVSFGIPLAAAPESLYVPAPTEEEEENEEFPVPPAGCTGNVKEPGAEEGHLCVFARFEQNNLTKPNVCSAALPSVLCLFGSTGVPGTADPSGAFIGVIDKAPGLMLLNGTWAVTAE
jgi:hypothetical protein